MSQSEIGCKGGAHNLQFRWSNLGFLREIGDDLLNQLVCEVKAFRRGTLRDDFFGLIRTKVIQDKRRADIDAHCGPQIVQIQEVVFPDSADDLARSIPADKPAKK